MNGIRATLFGHSHQLLDVEIALSRRGAAESDTLVGEKRVRGARIRFGIDRDCRDAHLAAGPHHAEGDLAAVRDQNLGDASQSSSTRRWDRRWLPLWRTLRAPSRRRS